ncbi:hypothetical protein [Streptomyces sp. 8N616]|uniref:hypothetical protein n=1 Tax=Streptomyces sp. 8N616 TaxID=3457414 RepID=UPI003FD24637
MAVRFTVGGVLEIPLSGGRVAYGEMLATRPYLAFFAGGPATGEKGAQEALQHEPLFIVAVHKSAYSQGRWGSFVHRAPKDELPAVPEFFRQNAMNLADCQITDALGNTRPATPQQCVHLERSAVWEAEHIESRLEDHYAGRPNAFVESLRVKL